MNGLSKLRQKVADINSDIKQMQDRVQEVERKKNTTAIRGTYSNGKIEVEGGYYPCLTASKDILLKDGCSVYVLPTRAGGYVIVGGGV
ncbi:hypothetical protein [Selenomonas ruminantium]|uniref:hypothetical protein n=1 Tax=Selenomonas ruminantium TaxID=971 RepID=UPI0005A51D1D|nr:hypothetical protein [Selenomonas ruminantium]